MNPLIELSSAPDGDDLKSQTMQRRYNLKENLVHIAL